MDEQKTQIVDKLKQVTNVLVTVSANPSVDQLSAAIGLTLFLNKIGKHGSAVYSGKTPSAIEFLEPQKTLEKTTDSLRDFIIALDKAKADKLRYKVEDQMVKIFITPYQTSITEKDLEFSHGDFNVEVVMALGVHEQGELDQAITAQGNILHDATVFGIGVGEPPVALGSTNWNDPKASSLSEMIASLCGAIKPDAFDGQMATAMMTGIVAETERFSNEKTSSETMQLSAKLMHAGANQQLVASQLQKSAAPQPDNFGPAAELPEPQSDGGDAVESQDKASSDGSLHITHGDITPLEDAHVSAEPTEQAVGQIHIDADGTIKDKDEKTSKPTHEKVLQPPSKDTGSRLILEPPSMGANNLLTTAGQPDSEASSDPLTGDDDASTTSSIPEVPLLSHDSPKEESKKPDNVKESEPSSDPEDTVIVEPTNAPPIVALPPVPAENKVISPLDSLANLEKTVDSPHVEPAAHVDEARAAVSQAMSTTPVVAPDPAVILPTPPSVPDAPTEANDPGLPPGFTSLINPTSAAPPIPAPVASPSAPPPVPPPMMPPTNPPAGGSPGATAL